MKKAKIMGAIIAVAVCAAGVLYMVSDFELEHYDEDHVPLDKDEISKINIPRGVIKDGESLYRAVEKIYNLGFLVTGSNLRKESYKNDIYWEGGQKEPSDPLPAGYLKKLISNEGINKQRADIFISLLGIKPGINVADVGAGPGTLTRHLARAVLPGGKVWASEPDMQTVTVLHRRVISWGLPNISVLFSYYDDSLLPANTFNLALLINVHAFAYPNKPGYQKQKQLVIAFYKTIAKALRPKGRLAIFDTEQKNKKEDHLPAKELIDQLKAAGFQKTRTHPIKGLDYDCTHGCHFFEFQKPGRGQAPPLHQ